MFSVLDHPNPSAKSSPYGSIFYAFHLAGALVNRLVSGPCLFSNALLCPDLWATVYTAAAAVFVFLFSFSFFFFATGNAKRFTASTYWRTEKLGKGKVGMHEFVLKII